MSAQGISSTGAFRIPRLGIRAKVKRAFKKRPDRFQCFWIVLWSTLALWTAIDFIGDPNPSRALSLMGDVAWVNIYIRQIRESRPCYPFSRQDWTQVLVADALLLAALLTSL